MVRSGDLQTRTRAFALRVIREVERLPRGRTSDVLGRQLLRCGTSVGANYRAACRAKSTPDFIAKLKIVEEEADESLYWLGLLRDAELVTTTQVADLVTEGNELLAMVVASIKTARIQPPRTVKE
ncbi:MAG TPA: four helix bundle protein [Thermomicrobiales bacterium]|jgi:four helix bundle protein